MKNKSAQIFKSTKENYADFASDFLHQTLKRIETVVDGKINIALSGGTTPLPVLEKLKLQRINWERYNFFMVDERCVPVNSELSNFGNINKIFFKFIPSKYFSMVQNDTSFIDSVTNYKMIIKEQVSKIVGSCPQFDLILLGMGDDGHTASLFPQTDGLFEENEIVIINKVSQLNTERITLTYPIILNASEIIVMVKGKKKAKMIERIYSNKNTRYPIGKIVREHYNLKWLIS